MAPTDGLAPISLEELRDAEAVEGIAIGRRPRRGGKIEYRVLRELGEADATLLESSALPSVGAVTPPIQRLRNTHHLLARLLAEGRSQTEASLATGYSISRVSLLTRDPMFQELVAHYRAMKEAQYLDVHARLASLGLSTIDELQERLETEPESFRHRELMELAQLCLDRSVTKAPKPPAAAITVNFVDPGRNTGPVSDVSFEEVPPEHAPIDLPPGA